MDVVLLRKLSRKSFLNFGKHSDKTVQQLLDLKNKKYLRWIYFNSSNISFLDDVLDEIVVLPEYRISKPGKEPELFDKLQIEINKHTLGFTKFKREARRRKLRRVDILINKRVATIRYSKGSLQRKNHGK